MSTRISSNLDTKVCHALMDYADEHDTTMPKAVNEALSDYFGLNEEEVEDEDDVEINDEDEDEEIDDDDEIEEAS